MGVEEEKNWMIPLKSNADPEEDPFQKLAQEKSERVAKNELQRLRNIAKAKKVNVPTVGVAPAPVKGPTKQLGDSEDLKKAAELAKESTASLGKFQEKLNKKLEKNSAPRGPKRKFESNTGDMDVDMAVGKQIYAEDHEVGKTQSYQRESKSKAKK